MEQTFLDYFSVGRNVVLSELQALKCDKFDVSKYVSQFNAIMAKYYWEWHDLHSLKDVFVMGLPFECKKTLMVY